VCDKELNMEQLSKNKKIILFSMYLIWLVMAVINSIGIIPHADERTVIKITAFVWLITALIWMYMDAKVHKVTFKGWHHPINLLCLPISFWFYGFKSRGVLGGLKFFIVSIIIAISMIILSAILSSIIANVI
jgi:hypothetical protein